MKYLIPTSTIILTTLLSNETIIKPDSFTKEGFCIVKSPSQKELGLKRFKTKEQFDTYCNGKMVFLYKKDRCRWFTMKNMNFDILIKDKNETSKFKINQRKKVCGRKIIEEPILSK